MKRIFKYICLIVISIISCTAFILQPVTFYYKAHKSQDHKKIRVAAVLESETNPFWRDVWIGVRKAAHDMDVQLSEYHYEIENDVEDLFETAVLAQVDGIILRSPDYSSKRLTNMIRKARKEGIKIVMVDTDGGASLRDMFVGIDNEAAGSLLADEISKMLMDNKKVMLAKTPTKAMTIITRRATFERRLKFLDIDDCIVPLEMPDQDELRIQALHNSLRDRDDIQFIVCTGAKTTLQIASSLSRVEQSKTVSVIGFCETEEAMDYVDKGIISMLLVQDNFKMGYTAMENLHNLLIGLPQNNDICLVSLTIANQENLRDVRAAIQEGISE